MEKFGNAFFRGGLSTMFNNSVVNGPASDRVVIFSSRRQLP